MFFTQHSNWIERLWDYRTRTSNEVFPISFLKKGLTYFSQFSSAKNALTIVLKDYVDGTEREELIRESLMELVRAKVFDSIHVANCARSWKTSRAIR